MSRNPLNMEVKFSIAGKRVMNHKLQRLYRVFQLHDTVFFE